MRKCIPILAFSSLLIFAAPAFGQTGGYWSHPDGQVRNQGQLPPCFLDPGNHTLLPSSGCYGWDGSPQPGVTVGPDSRGFMIAVRHDRPSAPMSGPRVGVAGRIPVQQQPYGVSADPCYGAPSAKEYAKCTFATGTGRAVGVLVTDAIRRW